MKKLLLQAVSVAVCAFGLSASAQMTTITATNISMGGTPVAAGSVTLTPVDAKGKPIPFVQGGGGLNSPQPFTCKVANGAITGICQVPDSKLTTPANISYSIQVSSTVGQKAFVLNAVPNITGSAWSLSDYAPSAQTTNVEPIQVGYGSAPPPETCVAPSFYVRNASGGLLYFCVNSEWVLMDGSSGGSAAVTPEAMSSAVATLTGCSDPTKSWSPAANACVANTGPQGPAGEAGPAGSTGADGEPGADGQAATVSVGKVTTGEAGSDASVTNTGTSSAAVLDFVIPKGDKGDDGSGGSGGGDVYLAGDNTFTGTNNFSSGVFTKLVGVSSGGSRIQFDASGSPVSFVGSNVTATSGVAKFIAMQNGGFTPSSGNAKFAGLFAAPNINGTCSGCIAYGILAAPRGNTLTGGTIKLAGFGTADGTGNTWTELASVEFDGSFKSVPLAGTGTRCLEADSTGKIVASDSDCGTGDSGSSATVDVGTVTTGDPGTEASVTNSGTTSAAVFDFTIPRGNKGDKGDTGSAGSAATVSIGTVTTGAAGSSTSVTNAGTSSAAVLNFTIPQGAKGDTGAAGVSYWSCQPGLGDGLNTITTGTYIQWTCRNDTGSTVTITGIACIADAGSSTVSMTNGSDTALLSSAITCGTSYTDGTQSGTTTLAAGDFIKLSIAADGSKQVAVDVKGTL